MWLPLLKFNSRVIWNKSVDWGEMIMGYISAANASWPVYKLSKILLACAGETLSAALNTSPVNFGMWYVEFSNCKEAFSPKLLRSLVNRFGTYLFDFLKKASSGKSWIKYALLTEHTTSFFSPLTFRFVSCLQISWNRFLFRKQRNGVREIITSLQLL